MWEKLMAVDHRIIYLVLAVAIIAPLFSPFGMPISINQDMTQKFFDVLDKLPAGSVVWMGADYSPGASAELNPQLAAVFRHCMSKGHKVIIFAMFEQGGNLARNTVDPIAKELGKQYGVDYVNLGYKPGSGVTLRAMVQDLYKASAGVDINGDALDKFPLTQQVKKLDKEFVHAVVSFCSGSPGDAEYRLYVTDPQNIPLLSALVAANIPGRMPFLRAGQIRGIVPGLRGAAEYEKLINKPGTATRLMDAQSLGHLIIILFILVGNVAFVATRKK